MKNVNDLLSEKYWQLLSVEVTPVPVFRDYVPFDLGGSAYLLISAISNTNLSTMQTHDTTTSIQVGIYTRSTTDNNTTQANELATKVYETILPETINQLTVNGVQVLTTELANDTSPDVFDTGTELFINRFITFNHKINHSLN